MNRERRLPERVAPHSADAVKLLVYGLVLYLSEIFICCVSKVVPWGLFTLNCAFALSFPCKNPPFKAEAQQMAIRVFCRLLLVPIQQQRAGFQGESSVRERAVGHGVLKCGQCLENTKLSGNKPSLWDCVNNEEWGINNLTGCFKRPLV